MTARWWPHVILVGVFALGLGAVCFTLLTSGEPEETQPTLKDGLHGPHEVVTRTRPGRTGVEAPAEAAVAAHMLLSALEPGADPCLALTLAAPGAAHRAPSVRVLPRPTGEGLGAAGTLVRGSAAEDILHSALSGPTVAYDAVQRAEVVVDGGTAIADARVRGNGRGATRYDLLSGPAAGTTIVLVAGSGWVRAAGRRWSLLPGARLGSEREAVQQVIANYEVWSSDGPAAGGRGPKALALHARGARHPARQLWLIPTTGFTLRDERYGSDGRLRSATSLTGIQVRQQAASLFALPGAASAARTVDSAAVSSRRYPEQVRKETGFWLPKPAYVPTGFRTTLVGVLQARSGRKMPWVRYSDGVAAFTVFRRLEARPSAGAASAGQHRAARTTLHYAAAWRSGSEAAYLLVGDIPEAELSRVAQSLP